MIELRISALRGASLLAIGAVALAACETTTSSTVPAASGAATEVLATIEDGGSEAAKYPAVLGEAGAFSAFMPAPSGVGTEINYEVISEGLQIIVFNTGPSTRIRARDKQGTRAGSRLIKGHDSPYRLEGNKIFLSQFDDDSGSAFRDYANSLEAIGNQIDITALPKNEQLAYWYNLHNMWVIALIAEDYPVRYPERIKVGANREPFHDGKIINIRGVEMSLSDIRRNIVYRYWDDPRVMYGFFHGDLGSPNINDQAFTSENLSRLLDRNAKEFVNSLRGVQKGNGQTYISKLYYEARPGLFPNWPGDLRRHLAEIAQDDVGEILAEQKDFRAMKYPNRTADMVGGDPRPDIQAGAGRGNTPPQLVEMVEEVRQKYQELRRQGRIGGARVIIIDNPTIDTGAPTDDTVQ